MAGEILSQADVDALLMGEFGEAPAAESESDVSGGVKAYNLATQDRIVRGRMPTLEVIHERFARNLRLGLFNLTRRTPEIAVGPVRLIKFGEFVKNLVVPTNLNMVNVKPLRGTGLMIFDPNLVFLVIDNLFGGDGRFHVRVEGREFTSTEQRVIQRLLNTTMDELEKAWEPVHPLKFEYIRSEMNTQFANIANPSEIVMVASFTIEMGAAGGEFYICLPYSMIEPIKGLLSENLGGDRMEFDERWVSFLSNQVAVSDVTLVANLAEVETTVKQLLELKIGDTLPIAIPNLIKANVEGVPLLECSYGIHNDKYALKVSRQLEQNTTEFKGRT